MLEILALSWLCRKNATNAMMRGRKPGWANGYTVILWFAFEFTGLLLGISADMGYGAYALALMFTSVGALISWLIAKRGEPIVQPNIPAQLIPTAQLQTAGPCRFTIIRDKSMVGAAISYKFTLNGQPLGALRNGGSLTGYTTQLHNVVSAVDPYGWNIKEPFSFDAAAGGSLEIHFKAGKFLPALTKVMFSSSVPTSVSSIPAKSVCPICGNVVEEGEVFCGYCGAKQERNQPQKQSEVSEELAPKPFCPSCKAAVRTGDHFCLACGANLNT